MNEQYLNQTIRRIVYLESLKQSEINKLTPHIKAIDKLIKEQRINDAMEANETYKQQGFMV